MLISTTRLPAQDPTPAEETESTPAPERPKAVFVNKIGEGKDPFFPNSPRREKQDDPGDATHVPVARNFFADLKLKSVTDVGSKKFAIINNTTFEEGEERTVETPNGPLKIKCVQIRISSFTERSVKIEIPSQRQTIELWMPKEIFDR